MPSEHRPQSKKRQEERPRRGNGPKSRANNTRKWVKSGRRDQYVAEQDKSKKTYGIADHPSTFDSFPARGRKLSRKLCKVLPNASPLTLPLAPESGTLRFKLDPESKDFLPPGHPGDYILPPDKVVTPSSQKRISAVWEKICETGARPGYKKGDNRLSTPAFHFGMWSHYMQKPQVTTDTTPQDKAQEKAIHKFPQVVSQEIGIPIAHLLKYHNPTLYNRHMEAHARVHKILSNEKGYVDLHGAFFTVAVKEGSSEVLHLDFNDATNSLTWLVPVGDYSGGEFCAPQLNIRIPVKPGYVLAATTRRLVHCGTLAKGKHIVLTLFTDKFSMSGFDAKRF